MADQNNSVGIEKLDKNNYQPWKFRMRNYLIGKSLWGYVTGEEMEPRLPLQNVTPEDLKAWKAWNEKDKKVMFLISQNVSNGMIGHIQDLDTSKDAWDTLERLYSTNTKARKIQLKNELNNMKKNNLSVNDYVLKIKEVSDALGSIGATPEDDDLVSAVLNGLNDEKWKAFSTSVYVREKFPDFEELISLMITEEMRMQGPNAGKGSGEQAQAFYSNSGRGRGRSQRGRGGGGRFGNYHQNQKNQNFAKNTGRGRGRGNQRGRGSFRGRGGWQQRDNSNSDGCWICGKTGHFANECYHNKSNDRRNGRPQ